MRPCDTTADCAPDARCIHELCVAITERPDQDEVGAVTTLRATPLSLAFGAVAPTSQKRLALILQNDGGATALIDALVITPADAPFAIEPLGSGPLWVRAGRTREMFVRYTGTGQSATATLEIRANAPTVTVTLAGN